MLRDLDDLRAFVETVNRGGFAAASAALQTTATVVNRRVSRLESALGARLVTRSTRGATPTEEGRAFHARCQDLLRQLDEACLDAGGTGHELAGRLRVTAPSSLERLLIQPVVSQLMRAHPRLRFELLLNDRRVDLLAHDVDLAIRGGSLDDSSMVARRLAVVSTVLAASPDYLDRCGVPSGPEDLASHTLLEHVEAGLAHLARPVRGADGPDATLPRPRQSLRVNDFEALLELAVAGLGVCVAPEVQLAEALADGRLRRVPLDLPLAQLSLWAVFPSSRQPSRRLRALVDALVRHAERPLHEWGRPCEAAP